MMLSICKGSSTRSDGPKSLRTECAQGEAQAEETVQQRKEAYKTKIQNQKDEIQTS